MNWSDERYVKLYVRPTATYRLWPWQTKAIFPWLLARCDGSGLIDVGRHGIQGVAALVEMPIEIVEAGMKSLVEDGTIEAVPRGFLVPKFIEAQEATKTERAKKRDQRERLRSQAREVVGVPVPSCPDLSRVVPLQPSPAQPSPAHVEDTAPASPVAAPKVVRKKPKADKPTDPRHTPLKLAMLEAFMTARGVSYPFQPRDGSELSGLLAMGKSHDEILDAWKRALRETTFPKVSTIAQFRQNIAAFVGQAVVPVGSGDWRSREDHTQDFFKGET